MKIPSLSKQVKFFIKLAVTLVLVAILVMEVDWKFVLKELQEIHWPWLLIYFILQIVGIFLSVKRWQVIASEYNLRFSLDDGMFVYLKGMFLNNFLPTTIGGDAYRCWWLGEKTGFPAASYASVVLDRIVGLYVTLGAAFVSGIFILQLVMGREIFTFTFIGIFGAVIIASYIVSNLFFGWGNLPFQNKPFFQKSFFSFLFQKRSWQNVLNIFFWSGAFTFIALIVSNYFLFLALGIALPPLAFTAIILVIILYSNIPISINNIGLKEWAYATFFVFLAVPLETAVAVALLSRFFQIFISSLVIPLAFLLGENIFFEGGERVNEVGGTDGTIRE